MTKLSRCLLVITLVFGLLPGASANSAGEMPELAVNPLQEIVNPPNTESHINSSPYVFRRSWGGEADQIHYPRGSLVTDDGILIFANSGLSRITLFDQSDNSVTTIGGYGTDPGSFNWPGDIAMASDGTLFVTDTGNDRIQHITMNGSVINLWGSYGSGPGQFWGPNGIAISTDNFIYVTEVLNNRVQKFTLSGEYLMSWGSTGTGPGQFRRPDELVIDDLGYVYVLDLINNRVQKFDANGNFILQWGTEGGENAQLLSPDAIAIDLNGNILVSDYGGRIRIFSPMGSFLGYLLDVPELPDDAPWISGLSVDKRGSVYVSNYNYHKIDKLASDGTYLRDWGSRTLGAGSFRLPQTLSLTPSGDVLVPDYFYDRIQVFSPFGSVKAIIGQEGSEPGQFIALQDVTTDPYGYIYVADSGNSRIQVFNQNREFIRAFGSEGYENGQWQNLISIAVGSDGNIYGLDSHTEKVQKFSNTGDFIMSWSVDQGLAPAPRSIHIDQADNVYISDGLILQYDVNGNFQRSIGVRGGGVGQLWDPWGIHVTVNGTLFIADAAKNEIIVLNSSGEHLYSIGSPGYNVGGFNSPVDVAVTSSSLVYAVDRDNERIQVFSPQPLAPDPTTGLVLNGSFENEPPLMEWTYGGNLPVSRNTISSLGSYSMRLGQPVPRTEQGIGSAWSYTNLYVDPAWARPVLTFKYRMYVNDIMDYSDFFVAIQDGAGLNHLETILRDGFQPCVPGQPPTAGQDLGWRSGQKDLSAYKGQHIRIVFSNRNLWPQSWGIWTNVDDVRVLDAGPMPPLTGPYLTNLPLIHFKRCDVPSLLNGELLTRPGIDPY